MNSQQGNRHTAPSEARGHDVFGEVVKHHYPNCHLTGIEIDNERHVPHQVYDSWINNDFNAVALSEMQYDMVLGNPPYVTELLKWILKIRHSLTVYGVLAWILRTEFVRQCFFLLGTTALSTNNISLAGRC